MQIDLTKPTLVRKPVFESKQGRVFKFLDDELAFLKVGEIYRSEFNPYSNSLWKLNENSDCKIWCVYGELQVSVLHARKGEVKSDTPLKFRLTAKDNTWLYIPSNVWYSFQNLNDSPSSIINVTDLNHNKIIKREMTSAELGNAN